MLTIFAHGLCLRFADNLNRKIPCGHCGPEAGDCGCGKDRKAAASTPPSKMVEPMLVAAKKLTILAALSLTIASLCTRIEAQTNRLAPGIVVGWGQQVIPYVQPATRYQGMAAGANHSLALTSDGTVVAGGDNYFCQSTVPANLTGVIAIAAGACYHLALQSEATVLAWGSNEFGQSTVP